VENKREKKGRARGSETPPHATADCSPTDGRFRAPPHATLRSERRCAGTSGGGD
jgi:hypothetical protein